MKRPFNPKMSSLTGKRAFNPKMSSLYVKRAFNPNLSSLYEARKQRSSSEKPNRFNGPINLENVESLLSEILEDLDVILDEWKSKPQRISENSLTGLPLETYNAMNQDSSWLKEALSKL